MPGWMRLGSRCWAPSWKTASNRRCGCCTYQVIAPLTLAQPVGVIMPSDVGVALAGKVGTERRMAYTAVKFADRVRASRAEKLGAAAGVLTAGLIGILVAVATKGDGVAVTRITTGGGTKVTAGA